MSAFCVIKQTQELSGPPMIVCSCNVLSDTEVRTVANTATRRTTSYVFSCLGCRVRAVAAPAPSEKSWTRYLTERKSVVRMAAPYSLRRRTSSPRLHGAAIQEAQNKFSRVWRTRNTTSISSKRSSISSASSALSSMRRIISARWARVTTDNAEVLRPRRAAS
jgi:hypothetical protein